MIPKERIKRAMFFWFGMSLMSFLSFIFTILGKNTIVYTAYAFGLSVVIFIFWLFMYIRKK